MPNPVLLNNIDHQQMRIIGERSARYGDAVMYALALPSEFRDLQAHYPIVFRKTDDGTSLEPVALFGFEDGENLFLQDDAQQPGWDASYIPWVIERQPFLIGVAGPELMVHVDLDNPRVNQEQGEALFLPHGGSTPYLERMNSLLLAIHQGLQSTAPFIATLLELELLESFVLDVELNSGSQHRLIGFYTINEDKLNALDGTTLARLNQSGYLKAIYMTVASLSNFRALIDRKNRRHDRA
jgi:SapC